MKKVFFVFIVVFLLSAIVPSDNTIYKVDNITFAQSKSVRCNGITKKGAQCKRKTTNSNGYCWQHQNQAK
ncbi:MAG: DUF5763 domain-containing protein [Ignavibacteria bacterium]